MLVGGRWLDDALDERERQEQRVLERRRSGLEWESCASTLMPAPSKLAVLAEEFGEVAREVVDAIAENREPAANLRVELVQLIAVAGAWVEAIDEGSSLERAYLEPVVEGLS